MKSASWITRRKTPALPGGRASGRTGKSQVERGKALGNKNLVLAVLPSLPLIEFVGNLLSRRVGGLPVPG
jgi:hypothetical protein